MNLYLVKIKRNQTVEQYRVAAETIERALEDTRRYCKANWYSYEIICIDFEHKINIFYKSAAKVAKKRK